MFWKYHRKRGAANTNPLEASEVISQVGGIYADRSLPGQLVQSRSILPCPWFTVRECFVINYEKNYLQLLEDTKSAYHLIYTELAFFVDDHLYSLVFKKRLPHINKNLNMLVVFLDLINMLNTRKERNYDHRYYY